MSEVKMELKEKTKALEKACEKLTNCLDKHLDEGLQDVDAQELESVANSIHYLSEAKEKTAKAMYYEQIIEAMEKGDDAKYYEEVGMTRGYRGRSATTGRFVHRAFEEKMMRDMDKPEGRMYYSAEGTAEPAKGYEEGHARGYEDGYTKGYEDGNAKGYAHTVMNRGADGNFEMARKGYKEAKEHNGTEADKTKHREKLQHLMDTVEQELAPFAPTMDATEKQIVRNGLQKMMNKYS